MPKPFKKPESLDRDIQSLRVGRGDRLEVVLKRQFCLELNDRFKILEIKKRDKSEKRTNVTIEAQLDRYRVYFEGDDPFKDKPHYFLRFTFSEFGLEVDQDRISRYRQL